MTDISRHLKGIQRILYNHIKRVESLTPADTIQIRQDICAFLPESYGIGSGRLVNAQGQYSAPFER
jgi:hypothetical protein